MKKDQKLQSYLRNKGKKLGYLIANSTLSHEMQLELIELMSKMSIEQIDRLLYIFEAKFVNEQTNEIDNDFKIKIVEIIKGFKEARQKNTSKANDSINNFNKTLKA